MSKRSMVRISQIGLNTAQFIVQGARVNQEVVGTRLLESLRAPVAAAVRESSFNPKNMDMTFEDVCTWLDHHIVFDHEGAQIGLRDGDTWLWKVDVDA